MTHLTRRERLHPVEHGRAHVPSQRRRGAGAVVHGTDVAHDLDQGDPDHHGAEAQDVTAVTFDDAAVDDVRVEGGQVERGAGLQELQQHEQGDGSLVGLEMGPQESYEHAESLGVVGEGDGCPWPLSSNTPPALPQAN
ncbi:hypothetical protein SHKM778_76420 [Streptomyces sp. KM77-8]|uniref:DUF5709 domain-containing protein n=1 Tax=Streptomyces haneummycinicus TaxID=3074435 RepID=A0AAT9HVE9_9ACTN